MRLFLICFSVVRVNTSQSVLTVIENESLPGPKNYDN